MFGGETIGGVIDDTWAFSGGDWVEITPAGSPPGDRVPDGDQADVVDQQHAKDGGRAERAGDDPDEGSA